MVFNSAKYLLESLMNRKPATDVEIIDECDEFLDNFSNQRTINIERLENTLKQIFLKISILRLAPLDDNDVKLFTGTICFSLLIYFQPVVLNSRQAEVLTLKVTA